MITRLPVRRTGFSLIELMIVVAIIGIVAAIAVPSYSRYRLSTVRGEGMECLTAAHHQMEAFYARSNRYATDIDEISINTLCGDAQLYSLSLIEPDGDCPAERCYEFIATPTGSQQVDGELHLRYDYAETDPSLRLLRTREVGSEVKKW